MPGTRYVGFLAHSIVAAGINVNKRNKIESNIIKQKEMSTHDYRERQNMAQCSYHKL